jgi:hypothetical protein
MGVVQSVGPRRPDLERHSIRQELREIGITESDGGDGAMPMKGGAGRHSREARSETCPAFDTDVVWLVRAMPRPGD